MGLGRCYQSPGGSADAMAKDYRAFLASTYGVAVRLQPTNAEAYVALGEGLRMYGVHERCPELGSKNALEMYKTALQLAPDNTCAATHVSFGDREPCDTAEVEELMACDEATDAMTARDEGDARSHPSGTGVDIESLSVSGELSSAAGLADALVKWRRNGLVVFPQLLSSEAVADLLERVRAAQHGNHTRDYTPVTRDKAHRCHKALPVDEARGTLEAITRVIGPFLEAALGTLTPTLLESGFMVTAPGASAQLFHRDVAPSVVSCSSMTVSIQVGRPSPMDSGTLMSPSHTTHHRPT